MRGDMMSEDRAVLSEKLIKLMTLEQVGENEFLGAMTPQENSLGRGRVYGGLVVAQALAAAEATAPHDRPAASLHCRFLREGDEARRIRYQVTRDMDGGSVSHRRVTAEQDGVTILTFSAMLHRRGEGVSHQPDMPNVPSPESLRADFARSADALPFALRRYLSIPRLVEMVPVDHAMLDHKAENIQPFRAWVRPSVLAVDDVRTRRAMLAYASDSALLLAATLRHGLISYRDEIRGASLDHALWIHDDPAADDWMLYVSESPWTGQQRGLTRGHLFARDGRLIASAAQEGLLRLMTPAA
ncbi:MULTISPECIES: acyl-CoA thioesterase [unclassified Sphingobium]|uniref:acyl-CoA thioesterase n=1 Tax=unclassified Sphingobium TaxID=2611147 RepID=UPI00119C0430|nr:MULTISPECIES: acyl-CoA thioesterase domain-containing protein [unclassified Sphingobium]MBG6119982.1 acyl-CoA thioesterase-2 [Sphingobium sp. JAI105]TWC99579.1 acyl-CoA thioesterase-2 [Sphingobium sp. AEW010]TWD18984.1 acyl-CoA thioesterase-2 [Sphingobium sp. AEW013]TWD21855.1 acyl-CoA thioesterase-2 [Sphingobium sp. AEW001]